MAKTLSKAKTKTREDKLLEGWTVNAVFVYINEDGSRTEKPVEEIPKEELKEIVYRKNLEALRAAGYIPVEENKRRSV